MNRRVFLQSGLAATVGAPLLAALRQDRLDEAADVLAKATAKGTIASSVLHVTQRDKVFTKWFGNAKSADAMFLLGSISKPMCVTALMTLFDQGKFGLDDPVKKFIPQFTGEGRDTATIRHLLSHASGLPDQLPENNLLRKKHAGLLDFVEGTIRTPLSFAPGSQYQYSSMAILLATRIAELISGVGILELMDQTVFQPLGAKHSVLGLGKFKLEDLVPVQTEFAAPEAGAGDPAAKDWDWNSLYWRKLGAPWGGVNCSALDLGLFMAEFLFAKGAVVKPTTAKLMITNHNKPGQLPRGLGFGVGAGVGFGSGSAKLSDKAFGHTGSTGTIAWADPASETICVVLTSLPGRAIQPHPRELAAEKVVAAIG